jgi:hypothetical protein
MAWKNPNKRRYVSYLPKKLPKGTVLIHNHVLHTPYMNIGQNGFRIWLANPNPDMTYEHMEPTEGDEPTVVEPCPCGYAPHLGTHYRIKREPDETYDYDDSEINNLIDRFCNTHGPEQDKVKAMLNKAFKVKRVA